MNFSASEERIQRGGYHFANSIFYAALAAGIAAVVVFLVLRVKYGGLKGLYSKGDSELLLPAYGALRSGGQRVTRCMPGSSCSVLCSVSRATYGDLKMDMKRI